MPPQTAKSRFTGTMKANAAAPIEWPDEYGELPGGITAAEGIARISVIRIQNYKSGINEGKPHLYAAGIVESPAEVATRKMVYNTKTKKAELVEGTSKMTKTKGLRTMIMLPLCGTGKGEKAITTEANIETMNNQLKRLFGQNFMADNNIETDDDLDLFLAAVSKADPPIRFRFSTQWNPPHLDEGSGTVYEDGVWPHKWSGTQGLENYVPDQTESNGHTAGQQVAPPAKTEPERTPQQDGKHLDYTLMAKKAEAKDMDARKRLREAAMANGWTEAQIDDPTTVGIEDTWAGVAQMAENGLSQEAAAEPGPDADAPQEQEAWVPKVGDQVWVQLRDKNGKPAMGANRKPKPLASAEIKKVYAKDEAADCLDGDDKKTLYAKVAYADLTQA